ncbi:tRNA pseudouridine(38-40) synthase TruA [Sodaliphilus pleomorphus]|uniref:tRNA pseudouridine(38-40) synthase TruA n=1 Tax=Sodaliphilus pleomorphus TaxID=2606626 RepID=UPI00240A4191|nr:tRNA pseudouridine(38-40) synthase TruA [Sodaliphilus pleomorphus]MDD6687088.1 tRNA pseudouridine(38-40) synthase TruA [Sodaliphilus pleomorphus]
MANMRVFIYLSFDGTAYHGWQIQPNAISVQQRLTESLTMLLRQPTEVVGAGRTDAGVHAHMMVAHCDVPDNTDLSLLCHKLNRVLPSDIAVSRVVKVVPHAHARFDAQARTYHYWIYTRKNPFRSHYATRITYSLDFDKMNEAAAYLLTVSDFTSFSKLHTDVKTNICHVTQAHWEKVEEDLWRFEITADRFLRNMVRSIVGTLIEVGRGKLSLDDFKQIVALKNRQAAGDSMPGNALSLVQIKYHPDLFL